MKIYRCIDKIVNNANTVNSVVKEIFGRRLDKVLRAYVKYSEEMILAYEEIEEFIIPKCSITAISSLISGDYRHKKVI
jgi:hypothetical protein